VEGRTGEATQGASHRQHHRHSRVEGHWGCRPCAADEARFVIRSDADIPAPERVAVANTGAQHGIRKDRETDMLDKLFAAFLRRADEGTLSRLLVEVSVVLASGRSNGTNALREAATVYKVDTDAITLKVKQEFAAKTKAKKEAKPVTSGIGKSRKAA